MELIVKDAGGDWHFDGDKTYYCLNKSGDKIGKMPAEYIPDPVLLWQSKCEAASLHISDPNAKLLKSSDVIYKLWEHKNANANN